MNNKKYEVLPYIPDINSSAPDAVNIYELARRGDLFLDNVNTTLKRLYEMKPVSVSEARTQQYRRPR